MSRVSSTARSERWETPEGDGVERAVADDAVRRDDVGVRPLAAQHLAGHGDVVAVLEDVPHHRRRQPQHGHRIEKDDGRIDPLPRRADAQPGQERRQTEENQQREERAGFRRQEPGLHGERQRRRDPGSGICDDEAHGEDGHDGAEERRHRRAAEVQVEKGDLAGEDGGDEHDVAEREARLALAHEDDRRRGRAELQDVLDVAEVHQRHRREEKRGAEGDGRPPPPFEKRRQTRAADCRQRGEGDGERELQHEARRAVAAQLQRREELVRPCAQGEARRERDGEGEAVRRERDADRPRRRCIRLSDQRCELYFQCCAARRFAGGAGSTT